MANKNQHVVPRDCQWAIRGSGNSKDTRRFQTQREAIREARKIAKRQKSELVIHGRDGKIRAKSSYGGDPNPPRDRR